jgi:hypothetical protein
MKSIRPVLVLAATVVIVSACVVAAPGASQVLVTRDPADVSACKAVGNIDDKDMRNLDPNVARNRAIGLNANAILNTGAGGIAYRCEK